MFSKVLVANRGEIAIRAYRAAYELGAKTVGVFPYEDRHSIHRQQADEAYPIGEEGHPVRAYLDIDEIIRIAKEAGADAIYPGYGFLSENPDLARAAEKEGITFVGPPPEVLELAGNKVEALKAAQRAGIPTLKSSEPSRDTDYLLAEADEIGFPIFVKAVAGGGGRGMRRVESREALPDALAAAMREADTAFGDSTVFLEQAVLRPRHIEVQILADAAGNVVHLHERDCSLQRRHQKVVEIAPAPNLDDDIRQALLADAVKFARELGYVNAGTVEFLVDTAGERAGEHVFIEMNPRIQVEHTVTEEVTDVDLVQSQMRIAAGETLDDLGIKQEDIHVRGFAMQCRITTEDPANGFRPDVGKVTYYRSAGGSGIRLDGGTVYTGAQISPHFDSMLVKLTCRGRTFDAAVQRAQRALAEFRIRGVATNIPFLRAVLEDETFRAGDVSTPFIDEHPELINKKPSSDRGTKALQFLADRTVNQPHGPRIEGPDPRKKLPRYPGDKIEEPYLSPFDRSAHPDHEPPAGWRQKLLELGPEGFAKYLRDYKPLAVTDTTMRDAHQSILATRLRTRDLLAAAPAMAHVTPNLFSAEAWGGATYDVALRFLHEDPWERLAHLRAAMPNIPIQMLLRGRNTVGYTPYPTEVTDAFVKEAAETGVDIFRIFDSLNDVSQMEPAIKAVRETGTAVAEVALCYTGNMLDPNEKTYTLDYYLDLAQQVVDAGAHIIAIKDMAGLLRPEAARRLVTALRERFDQPVHLHTHDTAGGQIATLVAAAEAGVDAVDVASASLAGTTSQPSFSALVAAMQGTERDPGFSDEAVGSLEPYWEAIRAIYKPFEMGLSSPTGRVYKHEIPGGQLSNLRAQATALGLGDRFEDIENMYAAADKMLGHIVKVTPSSKVVGDLALQLVGMGVDPAEFEENPQNFDVPDSVIGFLNGNLGTPPAGWPEPFRTKALQGRKPAKQEVTQLSDEDLANLAGDSATRRATLNRLLFPAPTREYEKMRQDYGDLSIIHTRDFLYGMVENREHVISLGKGVRLIASLQAISEPDDKGYRDVICALNGQSRTVRVRDNSVESNVKEAEKADPSHKGHIAAPFAGGVSITAQVGDEIAVGDQVATIEAMKMEASITSPVAGVVERVVYSETVSVQGGDLLLVLKTK